MPLQGTTLPAPYSGLDVVSPIDNMDPTLALELVNIFPGAGAPTVRKGYTQLGTATVSGQTEFMEELPRPDGTSQLIAAKNTAIYSFNNAGTRTDISKVGGYSSGQWNACIFANNMYLCNGIDPAQVYTGTGTCADITGNPPGGTTISDFINVSSYRGRLYFVKQNTLQMFFHDTVNVPMTTGSPSLKAYDFTYVMRRGGYLLYTLTYTNQTAATAQDIFLAVSSEGEIVAFTGYSPDDTNWSSAAASGTNTVIAHYYIGKPLGYRSFIYVNSDIWIITEQGVVSVSSLFQKGEAQVFPTMSKAVNPIITAAASTISFSPRWSGFFWPAGRRVYVKIPQTSSSCSFLVFSIDTGAWAEFKLFSLNDSCESCLFNKLPFYGASTGTIWAGETGQSDQLVSGAGQSIAFNYRSAFNFFGSRDAFKVFRDIRPLLKTRRGITLNIDIDTNFRQGTSSSSITAAPSTYTPWGSAWGSPWSSETEYIYDRYATKNQGHCGSVRVAGAIKNTSCQIFGFEIRYDVGGQV
jgi:hypothetical protein